MPRSLRVAAGWVQPIPAGPDVEVGGWGGGWWGRGTLWTKCQDVAEQKQFYRLASQRELTDLKTQNVPKTSETASDVVDLNK